MKFNYRKIAKVVMFMSIIVTLIGYFFWTIILPIPDFHIYSEAEKLIMQRRFAFNYPLGRFLLYSGFTGFIASFSYLITNMIKKESSK